MGETDDEQVQGAEEGPVREYNRTLIDFPYADLTRSETLAAKLAEAGGKSWIDQTQLAVALDMSVSGGTFRGRISAAKMFGFIETEGGRVQLSDLGVLLLDEQHSRTARVEGFLRVPLYSAMFESYNGFSLPPAATVERKMMSLGVPPKQADRARQAFWSSAQTAGFIASNGRFSKPAFAPAQAKDETAGFGGGGNGGGGGGNGNSGGDPPPPPPPVTEKALEYKLVDLMTDAMDDPGVMDAIIKVVTFLKARQAKHAKTGTGQ